MNLKVSSCAKKKKKTAEGCVTLAGISIINKNNRFIEPQYVGHGHKMITC